MSLGTPKPRAITGGAGGPAFRPVVAIVWTERQRVLTIAAVTARAAPPARLEVAPLQPGFATGCNWDSLKTRLLVAFRRPGQMAGKSNR